jgi:hypothetical protein
MGRSNRPTAVSALHALPRLLLVLVLGSALGAFMPLQGHFMPPQEARRSPHGRRHAVVSVIASSRTAVSNCSRFSGAC